MNLPQVFNNPEFGEIRSVEISEKVFFVGIDIAKALGYKNPNDAISRHCRGYVKHAVPTNSGMQEMNVIPEGDIYRLIVKSELPAAQEFEKWIFEEVIPQIRKTGSYSLVPQSYAEALRAYADEVERREKLESENIKMLPKAEFFDAVASSKDAIDLGAAAKVLDIGIGRNKLFELLRNKQILMQNNQPYQKFIDSGYFRVIEQKYVAGSETKISIKTLVYQKGLDFIRKLVKTA